MGFGDTFIYGILYAFLQELLDVETRLRNGGLGGVDEYADWEKKLQSAMTIEQFVSMFLNFNKYLITFLINPLSAMKVDWINSSPWPKKAVDLDQFYFSAS